MKRSYAKYIASLMLFGSNGIVAGYIALSSIEIVFFRTLIGALFLSLIVALMRSRAPKGAGVAIDKRHIAYICISGFAMGASWMFLYEAYARIGVGISTLLYYCGPVIVMVISPLLFRERIGKSKIIGFGAVLAGMVFLSGNTILGGVLPAGIVFGLMSALMYAVMVCFNKAAKSVGGITNAVIQISASFVATAAMLLPRQGINFHIEMSSIAPILVLGVVNTGIGCYLYFSSIQKLRAQSVAILGYIEPICALVLSVVVLAEKFNLAQLAGAVLIISGAMFGEFSGFGKNIAENDK